MRKSVLILVAIILVGSVATISFFRLWNIPFQREDGTTSEETTPEETTPQETTPQYVELKVNAYETSYSWGRDLDTDLPLYSSNVEYVIANQGTKTATNIAVSIYTDGKIFKMYSIPSLLPQSVNRNDFSLTIQYDKFETVKIEAETSTSVDSYTFTINAKLPRYLPWDIAKLYITPNNPEVEALVKGITGFPKWESLSSWVGENVEYAYDLEVHGQRDYWQLPTETVDLETGDCEDHAILLCSMLRSGGYDEDSAFVVIGYTEDVGHAWVRIYGEYLGVGMWINLEAVEGGFLSPIFGVLNIAIYDEAYQFNDAYFETLK